jgi:hypothetical protein
MLQPLLVWSGSLLDSPPEAARFTRRSFDCVDDDDPRSLHHQIVLLGLIVFGLADAGACLTFAMLSIWHGN